MRRRGLSEFGLLVTMALFAVVALLTVLILRKFVFSINNGFDDRETCRLSVVAHKALHVEAAGVDVVNPVDLDCRRRLVTFDTDHIEVNGEKTAFFDGKANETISSYDSVTPDLVNAVVADEMTGCWYQFLEGQTDFLGQVLLDWGDDERACFICSEISFEQPALTAAEEPFRDYLQESRVRKEFVTGDSDPTAYRYLFNDNMLCNARYADWQDTISGTIKTDDPCLLRYLTFWSDIGLGWIVHRTSDAYLHRIQPFLDPNIVITPATHTDEYIVLYMVEGGSWSHDLIQEIFGMQEDATGPTHAVWVLPADKLNEAACDAYFA